MLFYLDKNRKILDNNFAISKENALKIVERNPLAEWHEIEFSFTMGGHREGFVKTLYLEKDGKVRAEFTEIPPEPIPPLSEQEQIAIDTALNVEYIACLMEANLQQKIRRNLP